jgi:hypothetical protein
VVQDKIVYVGVQNPSFTQGSEVLAKIGNLRVSAKQVERVTKGIGQERCTERDEAVAAFLALPLTQRKGVPPGVTAPDVGVVGTDGGRLQIFDRAAKTAATASAVAESAAAGETRSRYWREDKIGLLMTLTSTALANDPCPEIPEGFLDPTRMGKVVRELRKGVPVTEEPAGAATAADATDAALHSQPSVWQPPRVQERRLLGSRQNWEAFGPLLAQATWAMGLYGAARRAFVGDGAENNWTLWRNFFSSFVPILDFIHALSYVYASAHAGRDRVAGWKCYREWIGWVWQGQVRRVLAALDERQAELGEPEDGDKETHPRQVVAQARSYLRNNEGRMCYAAYRRDGLPITSSTVESAVKQFNQRAKGTEKFWSEEGAEAILQLRGDHLSDDQPLEAFWERRQAQATGQQPYRRRVA